VFFGSTMLPRQSMPRWLLLSGSTTVPMQRRSQVLIIVSSSVSSHSLRTLHAFEISGLEWSCLYTSRSLLCSLLFNSTTELGLDLMPNTLVTIYGLKTILFCPPWTHVVWGLYSMQHNQSAHWVY
jgi:hypothetical protein